MRLVWLLLAVPLSLAALFFNIANAVHLWGALGGFLAFVAFPVMFIVVPIALLVQGEMPVYWLLLPPAMLFLYLSNRGE